MRTWMYALMALVLACNLTACGTKGKLKSPSQIKLQEEKEARREARKAAEAEKAKEAEEKAPTEESR